MLRFIKASECIHHKTNKEKVARYKLALEKGATFPPIEVMEKEGLFYVLDGSHRVEAHEGGEILAFVFNENDCPKKHLIGRRLSKRP